VLQALVAIAVPVKMARHSRRLLLVASLSTGAGKQVSRKVVSSTALILSLRQHLEKPNSKVQNRVDN
jgi:hypothetical protein